MNDWLSKLVGVVFGGWLAMLTYQFRSKVDKDRFEDYQKHVGKSIDEIKSHLDTRFEDMKELMRAQFQSVDQKFVLMDEKFELMDQRITSVETKIDKLIDGK